MDAGAAISVLYFHTRNDRALKNYITGRRLWQLWRDEFEGYNLRMFQRDLLAGITVAAVALPLALAFGVASGATAAAGLVAAIVAVIVIFSLAGASFQTYVSTGAMLAGLIVLHGRFGLEGVWVVGVMAGLMIILMGIFKWGQIINFIPSAVITGFTSGIAVIIFIGQIGNLLGIDTPAAENALVQLWRYVELQQAPNWAALGVSGLVIAIMVAWPKSWGARFPGSLAALVAATAAAAVVRLDVPVIGQIPQTILLDDRLRIDAIPWAQLGMLVGPAASVALLGAV